MGGTSRPDRDAPYNLLALHPDVHNAGHLSVHGRRVWSEERGYLIPKDHNQPERRPVLIHGRLWVLLCEEALYLPYPAELAPPLPE